MNKLIIYGDIHGCYEEFISLRNKINPKKNYIEVCVGDIITKGKDSIKTLDFIIEHNIKSVLGNHEDKIIRYLNHQNSNKKNPIKLDKDEQNIVNNLNDNHILYLKQLPLYLKFGNITVLHGGLQNGIKLENLSKRDKEKILRMRYLDENYNYLTYGKEDEKSIFWADIYDGNEGFIVYGHQWFEDIKKNKYTLGIDTGCVYGNKLTAVVFSIDNKSNSFNLIQKEFYEQKYIK
ncbi:metallophosphoesterase [Halarcobacter sp.]|uniref:metallophosphoesterase n=1 Tax=Halarcobacter sp. TaxID=2321133 RepID=UPI002AAB7A9E|nr:metallophosphoesterase [Halarcobacter sp.]